MRLSYPDNLWTRISVLFGRFEYWELVIWYIKSTENRLIYLWISVFRKGFTK